MHTRSCESVTAWLCVRWCVAVQLRRVRLCVRLELARFAACVASSLADVFMCASVSVGYEAAVHVPVRGTCSAAHAVPCGSRH